MSLRRNLSKYLALYSYVEAYRSNKLPEGYTKLSYIQGDGTAYIDLGISLTQDDEFELDFIMPSSNISMQNIFGYRDSASSNAMTAMIASTSNSLVSDFNNSEYSPYRLLVTISADTTYKLIANKNSRILYQGDTVVASNTTVCENTITTGNILVFNIGGTPAYQNKFTGSIKKVVISDRMDLIPCKDPNNNVGMYDIISGKFFGNVADSGAFVAGDEIADGYLGFDTVKLKDAIHGKLNELTVYGKTKNKTVDGLDSLIANGGTELIPETYLDTVVAKGKCVQENRLTNGLPSEYQELYYIESDGSAYINTNYIPNNETKVECIVDRPIAPANGYVWYPFTTENDPTNGQFAVFESTNSGGDKYTALTWGKTATSEVLTGATTAYSKSLFVLQNGVLTYDNNTKTITSPNAGQTFNCTKPITLFKRLNTTSNFVSVRMYSFKLYQSNALVMNLLPVRRKADGELGMYDTVSKTFLTNSGTGTFTASEDKLIDSTSSDYTILDYATFDGTQIIDTGVICNEESRIESKWIANSSSMWVYGTGTANPRITCYCVSSGNERFGNVTVDNTGITHNVLNTLTHDKNGFYYNGTNGKPYSNVGTFTCLDTLTIGNSNGSTGTPLFNGNFYYMRIYDNNVLIRSYIPVKRNSDNVVGFFDTVSGTFITPFEGNALVAGTVKTTWEPTPNFPVDIWCNNGKIDKYGDVIALPSNYTQLEYIESSGTQYIDTGLKINQNNSLEIDWMYHTTSAISTSGRVLGARYTGTSGELDAVAIGSNTGKVEATSIFGQFYKMYETVPTGPTITIGKQYNIKLSSNGLVVDGTQYGNVFASGDFETPYTLKLFAFEQSAQGSTQSTIGCGVGRCKQFKIWNGNTLVMDLIPAKNASGVVGMYDTVSGTFFTNAGTGDFVAGPTVDNRNVQEVITAPNGKNLFDKNNIQRIYGYFSATNAQWAWATNGNCVKIPCKPNTKYTARYDGTSTIVVLGFGSTYTDDEPSVNNVFVPVTNSVRTPNPTKDTPVTITTGANDKWLIVAWPADELYPDQYEEMRQHIIVEEGETPTEYEAGKGFNTVKCENLLSVGTYQDTQSILDGTITRNIGIKVLDGTEDWTVSAAASNLFYSSSAITNADTSNNYKPISTHFNGVLGSTGYTAMQIGDFKHGSNTSSFYFRIPNITTVVECKQWFADQYAAGTPVIIVYPLATPVTETTSSAILNKKEASVISGSLSISDLEVTSTESEHTVPTPLRPLSLRCNNGVLSTDFNDEYMTLEYLESSGAQYIDLGRVPNNNDIIEQKFQKKGSDTTTCSWYGSMPSSQTILPRIGIGSFKASGTASASVFAGANYTGYTGPLGEPMDTNPHVLRFQATGQTELTYTYDGVTFVIDASGAATPANFYEPAVELTSYLFARHGSNGVQTYDNEGTRIYYHREYLADGTLVMNLIPVKRKFDNVVGMYDTVSQTFFTNQGTGDLIAGPATVNVEGTQETIITVKETNLFDKSTTPIINAYVNANNGTLTAGTPGSSTQYSFVIPCKSNTTYKLDGMTALSGWGSFTDSTIDTVATVFTKGNDTLTTGPNDQYLIGMVYATGTSYDYRNTLDIREMDIMAYVENLLASGTYADTQDILTGLVTHNIGIKVLNGTENWQNISSYMNISKTDLGSDSTAMPSNSTNIICSHFETKTGTFVNGIGIGGSYVNFKYDSLFTTLAEWQQYLADQYAKGTPVIIVYPLAMATTESVDAQEMRNSPAFIKDASMEGLTLTQTHSIHTTPTPAFPLDLVCNNGVIKGISKNLFDPASSNITVGYWIRNSDGTPESSPANYYYNGYIPVKSDTNYIFFGKKKSDGTLSNYNRISWYDSTKTWISNSTYTMGTVGSGTSPANAAFARMSCNIDGSTLTTDYVLQFNWMFYEGTEEESFVPYGVVTEGNPEVLNIKGKNLFDQQWTENGAISSTGQEVASNGWSRSGYIKVIPGETYTWSSEFSSSSLDRYYFYYSDTNTSSFKSYYHPTPYTAKYYTITIPSGVNYIRLQEQAVGSTLSGIKNQFEIGPRPTKYEEYMNVDYSMPTLLSVGTYTDTQELQSGIYNGKVGVKVLDGTEEWNTGNVATAFTSPCWDSPLQAEPSIVKLYSTHFEGTDVTNANMLNNTIKLANSSLFSGNACIIIKANDFGSVEDFKAYLADQYAKGTPVIIVYPLANTSTETEESKSIYIDAGTNEISRIGGIDELEMEVKYKKLK